MGDFSTLFLLEVSWKPCISLPTMATCWLVVVSDHMVASMCAAPSSSPAHWACLRPSMNATPAGWCSAAASSIPLTGAAWRSQRRQALVGYKARLVDWARHDAPAVMELVAQRHPGLPITWFGHSMGGILFGMMPQHPRIDRVATLGSGSGYREHVARPLRYVMGVFWHVIVPLSVARHGYFAGRRIRTVDDLPRGVVAQWKRWCSHPDFVVSEGEAVRQAYASVKLPITAVVFTDDTMASPRGVKAMHSHYTGTQVDLRSCGPSSTVCALSGTSNSSIPRPAQRMEHEPALVGAGLRLIRFCPMRR